MADKLGDRIRAARERKGMTQAQLGEAVGAARETVGNWELGTTSPRNKMGKLQEVLGEDLDGTVSPAKDTPGVLLDIDPEAYEGMDPITARRARAEAEAAWYRVAEEARRRADDR
jgi:transcriptional regulator with XRE-family HTH domain